VFNGNYSSGGCSKMTRQLGMWILPVMLVSVAWGFIGVFGSIAYILPNPTVEQNGTLGMIMLMTGLLGWSVPAIVEFIEEGSVDLRPRFMK